jgi:hypothetical protein
MKNKNKKKTNQPTNLKEDKECAGDVAQAIALVRDAQGSAFDPSITRKRQRYKSIHKYLKVT